MGGGGGGEEHDMTVWMVFIEGVSNGFSAISNDTCFTPNLLCCAARCEIPCDCLWKDSVNIAEVGYVTSKRYTRKQIKSGRRTRLNEQNQHHSNSSQVHYTPLRLHLPDSKSKYREKFSDRANVSLHPVL